MIANKTQSTVEQLVSKIEQLESDRQKLEEARRLRAGDVNALEAERRSCVVAARVQKDPDAQRNVERITAKIAVRGTEDVFDADAIEQVTASLQAEKDALRREQWRARCEELNGLIRRHLKNDLDGAVQERTTDLQQASAALADSEKEIAEALRALDPSLNALAQELVQYFPHRRQWTNAWRLRDTLGVPVVEVPARALYNKQDVERWFTKLMERIDAVPESETKAKAKG